MLGGWVTIAAVGAQVDSFISNRTWQGYENGAMLFNPGDSSIHVLLGDGRVLYFSSTDYGSLPENPVQETTPAGSYRPLLGFGKIWGNRPAIRASLGWATTPETGYTAQITRYSDGFTFTSPNGEHIRIQYSSGTWFYETLGPSPTATQATEPPSGYIPPFSDGSRISSTYQAYENGLMLWIAGTGNIFVLYSEGDYEIYQLYRYASLPDNPGQEPPPGFYQPIFGFGKVWHNYPIVRARLGWATTEEEGRLTTFRRDDSRFSFSLPVIEFATLDSRSKVWTMGLR